MVGAGTGSRFGGPKQLAPCAGRRVIDWSVAAAAAGSDGVVLVLPESLVDASGTFAADSGDVPAVPGGPSRSASVRAGLAAVPGDAEIILVHDAARPAAGAAVFERVVEAIAAGADAAIPVTDVVDTIRNRGGGVVDRSQLVAVQTPQGFRAESLRSAHAVAPDATDDASLVEQAGGTVVHVAGSSENLKITTPVDLIAVEALLRDRAENSTMTATNAEESP